MTTESVLVDNILSQSAPSEVSEDTVYLRHFSLVGYCSKMLQVDIDKHVLSSR